MIIWIAGESCTGKTTVGDSVAKLLVSSKVSHQYNGVLRLDGDTLRVILSQTDIGDDANRLHLMRTYLQLALYSSLQGSLVIVSAVSLDPLFLKMFRDIPTGKKLVLLTADYEIREKRNFRGLNLTSNPKLIAELSEIANPKDSIIIDTSKKDISDIRDIIIQNIPDASDEKIMNFGESSEELLWRLTRDTSSINSYWETYYSKNIRQTIPVESPSNFGYFVFEKLKKSKEDLLIDIGCGSGRDSFLFSRKLKTIGLDASQAAIELAQDASKSNSEFEIIFQKLNDLAELKNFLDKGKLLHLYMRFFLHAINKEDELKLWEVMGRAPAGTMIYIEARTDSDRLSRGGIHISRSERINGHYRRFQSSSEILDSLSCSGFEIEFFAESEEFSPTPKDTPMLARIIGKKVRD